MTDTPEGFPPGFDGEMTYPGTDLHDRQIKFIEQVHDLIGDWVNQGDDQELAERTVAVLVWAGSSFGFMAETGSLKIDEPFFEAMMQNLKGGIQAGRERTREITMILLQEGGMQ